MSAGPLLDAALASTVLLLALRVAAAPRGRDAALAFVAFGMVLSLAWARLGSMDVALAEATIGAGVGGVLLLGAAARIEDHRTADPEDRPSRPLWLAIGLLCCAVAAALCAVVLTLPDAAPTLAPAATAALPEAGPGNSVNGVLLALRTLDTLLAALVLVLAVVGVWSLRPDCTRGGLPGPRQEAVRQERFAFRARRRLLPVGVLAGACVLWSSAAEPGGAFQSGAILAVAWLLAWKVGIAWPPPMASRGLRLSLVAGPAVGFVGFGVEEAALAFPRGFATPTMLAAGAALTVSVATALALLVLGPPEAEAPRG